MFSINVTHMISNGIIVGAVIVSIISIMACVKMVIIIIGLGVLLSVNSFLSIVSICTSVTHESSLSHSIDMSFPTKMLRCLGDE